MTERIWLVDTWAGVGERPVLVGEGSLAIWSWH